MSIVKGTGGYLSFTGSLITSYDYTILLWIKDAARTESGYYINVRNTVTTTASIQARIGPEYIRHSLAQTSAGSEDQSYPVAVDNWFSVAAYPITSRPRVYDGITESPNGGFAGDFIAESSPEMFIWADDGAETLDVGSQLAAIVIFDRVLSTTELDDMLVSDQNPLETYAADIVEFWDENTGISKDGSDNLITWTGYNGGVLTPSGTVTVDDTDMSPMDAPPVLSGGWNSIVKPALLTTDVTRVSATEIDITLGAYSGFDITVAEDVTSTIPAAALDSGGPIVATPAFTISALMGGFLNRNFFWGNY